VQNIYIYISVCMYVCTYACMHICIYACMYVCMHIYIFRVLNLERVCVQKKATRIRRRLLGFAVLHKKDEAVSSKKR